MASSLLRFTTSVVSFCPAAAIAISAFRLPTIRSTRQRSFSCPALPKITFDLAYIRHQMQIMDGVPSMLITVLNSEDEATVNIPGMLKTETDNGPCVSINMPGLRVPKGEYQAVAYDELIVDNNMLLYFKTNKQIYLAGIKLPENLDVNGKYNVLISKGVYNITLPVLKNTGYIMPDFGDATVKLPRPTAYCDVFNRGEMGQRQCQIMARPEVKSKSFTAYKKDTGDNIYLKGNLPGVEKIVVTREELCVSLEMPGFEIEDVESGFEYDTFIIEGKRGNEHYIAGIRVPEGFHRENHLIKKEMQDGVYKATLPRVDGNMLVFSKYR